MYNIASLFLMKYYGQELYHFGIPGQKWGKRNYQNEDGTWTEEGKARRRKNSSYSDDYKRYSELKKKSNKEMSNKEMQEYLNRADLESRYAAKHVSQGKKFISSVGGQIFAMTTAAVAAYLFTKGKNFVERKKMYKQLSLF